MLMPSRYRGLQLAYFILAFSLGYLVVSLLFLLSPQSHLIPPFKFVEKQATDKPSNQWNLLYHLGGNGPWIPKIDGVVDGGIATPNGCRIDMIHMVLRMFALLLVGELIKADVTTW